MPKQPKEHGAYKLAVYFHIHKGDKPKYFRSTKRQDVNNKFVPRMRKMIDSGDWSGKVNWACFYFKGAPLLEYNSETQTWGNPRPKISAAGVLPR